MHKKISKRAACLLSGFLSFVFAMVMAATLIITSSKYVMYHDSYGAYFVSPFEETKSFYENTTFQDIFYRDMTELSTYLACSSQLETEGEFDETKVIDVFEYQNRKEADTEKKQDYPVLTYRVGDLIEWHENGINHYYRGENDSGEMLEAQYEEDEGEYTITATEPEYMVEELYKPINVDSIFDLQLPEGLTYRDVMLTVEAVASDLVYNYHSYSSQNSKFDVDKNLKYMFVTKDDKIAYTNLNNQKNLSMDTLKTAFTGSKVYLVYDYAREGEEQRKFESSGINLNMIMAYKTTLSEKAYSFPEGGTLYAALQTETNDVFGKLNKNDFYANAASAYSTNVSPWSNTALVALVTGILALVTMLLFIVFEPGKKREQLRYFDKWFTEIAAGFAIISAVVVATAGVVMTKIIFMDLEGLTWVQRNNGYRICLLVDFSLLYLMLLFYMGSLVRRIKAGALWKGSFSYYVLRNSKQFFGKIKNLAGRFLGVILNNKNLIIRTFGPYGLFLFLNLLFPALLGGLGLIVNIVFDVAVGICLYFKSKAREEIVNGISRICNGDVEYQIKTDNLYGENKVIAQAVNQIGNAVKTAVQISMKDERLKADLITNVSHDIKTPLTSIINYVDLLKRENIQEEKAREYIRILDEKSQRLKQLTIDLVEASKISSGNITLEMEDLDVTELMKQTLGEYEDRLEEKKLNVVFQYPQEEEKIFIHADSRRMWRILENLFGNICKYAMEGTRVYVDIHKAPKNVEIILRNISAQSLNIPADELTKRFIRGDISRSTEGSGLGLSIAQNLTTAQGGEFEIYLDGDLFKVNLRFPLKLQEN